MPKDPLPPKAEKPSKWIEKRAIHIFEQAAKKVFEEMSWWSRIIQRRPSTMLEAPNACLRAITQATSEYLDSKA